MIAIGLVFSPGGSFGAEGGVVGCPSDVFFYVLLLFELVFFFEGVFVFGKLVFDFFRKVYMIKVSTRPYQNALFTFAFVFGLVFVWCSVYMLLG